jgi:acyl-CoA thioesterase I
MTTRNIFLLGFFFLFLALLLYLMLPTDSTKNVVNFPPKGARIIALGDSLTVGVGASTPERGFVPALERRIERTIENRGVNGDTTRDALLRLQKDALDAKPDIAIVLLGGNDYLKRVPEIETFQNLRSIITQLQSRGAVVLLVGIRGGLLADHFDDNFETLAEETGVLFVPNILDGIIGDPALMADEIHPNDRGYEKMVDRVAPHILMMLARGEAQYGKPVFESTASRTD